MPKYIIVWRTTRKLADIDCWHEPNLYDSMEAAIQQTATWLFPYSRGYYDIIPWEGL